MSHANLKILIATHKPYWVPDDSMYIPVYVGSSLAVKKIISGYQRDDEGENISKKNPYYCELTALYWAWKNLEADYVGLVHYRRHFKGKGTCKVLSYEEAITLLEKVPVVLPKKRNYYIETIESHYSNTFDQRHVEFLRQSITEVAPDYLEAFETHMNNKKAHMFNMFIMRRDLFNDYCDWLFAVLKATENKIDFNKLGAFEARCMGRLSEFLLDVWINVNNVEYVECDLLELEKTNWIKKGASFLAAKFFHKKYQKSF
jgi:hypothetical protein